MKTTDLVVLRVRCAALIEQHYRDPRVGPTWLARELFVSRRHLDRAFIGRPSVAEQLARRRLERVITVSTAHPAVPLAQITPSCGYGTYETFRAHCHRYLGCSPREAREAGLRAVVHPEAA